MPVTSYNRYSRYLHWVMAGLIIFMVFLGWRLEGHDSMRLSRVNIHKSVGMLILLLSFVRLGLRFAYKAPPEIEGPKWQMLAAKALHIGFYIVMIGLPLTGWAMVSTSAREIPMLGNIHLSFGWPHLPVPQNHDTHEVFEALHGLLAKLIIYAMIPLHIGAALKHHFVDKDPVMSHMVKDLTPKPVANWRWIVPVGVVAVAIGTANLIYQPKAEVAAPPADMSMAPETAEADSVVAPPAPSSASSEVSSSESSVTSWVVDKSSTKIGFSTTFDGEAINGGFSAFSPTIAFDAAQLDKSHIKVVIDLASVASGDADRDGSLKSDSFFNTAAFPKAVYEAKAFSQTDATHFVAKGKLTLHGVTKPLNLPFTLVIKNGVATVNATTDLDRLAFGVGSGDWAKTDSVPGKIKVNITLKAKAAK